MLPSSPSHQIQPGPGWGVRGRPGGPALLSVSLLAGHQSGSHLQHHAGSAGATAPAARRCEGRHQWCWCSKGNNHSGRIGLQHGKHCCQLQHLKDLLCFSHANITKSEALNHFLVCYCVFAYRLMLLQCFIFYFWPFPQLMDINHPHHRWSWHHQTPWSIDLKQQWFIYVLTSGLWSGTGHKLLLANANYEITSLQPPWNTICSVNVVKQRHVLLFLFPSRSLLGKKTSKPNQNWM